MTKVDYIIVGLGLSGLCIAEHLISAKRSVKVIDPNVPNASKVAGGMYNPVILKRFTLAWNADSQLNKALSFYNSLEQKLHITINTPLEVYRRFHSIEEQNLWFEASDKPKVKDFIEPKVEHHLNSHLIANHGFGKVNYTGVIDTTKLLEQYRQYLKSLDAMSESTFDYDALKIHEDSIQYKDIAAKGVIFCEGFSLLSNPYFNYLDIRPNKGEYLIIKSPELKLSAAVKSSIFIIPLGDDLYKIGATYDRLDSTHTPTTSKRDYLLDKLHNLITCSFEVVDQIAGIRPTTKDRRPYVGRHKSYKSLYVCNGLGSRGVMTAPVVTRQLFHLLNTATSLPKDIDANRHLN